MALLYLVTVFFADRSSQRRDAREGSLSESGLGFVLRLAT